MGEVKMAWKLSDDSSRLLLNSVTLLVLILGIVFDIMMGLNGGLFSSMEISTAVFFILRFSPYLVLYLIWRRASGFPMLIVVLLGSFAVTGIVWESWNIVTAPNFSHGAEWFVHAVYTFVQLIISFFVWCIFFIVSWKKRRLEKNTK